MSAINLYTTKAEALYFKDSQRNSFYEFGGVQLLPTRYYYQKFNYATTAFTSVTAYKVRDNSLIDTFTGDITIITSEFGTKAIEFVPTDFDFGNELIYLKLGYGASSFYYSNPFYYTSLDEDKTTEVSYYDTSNEYNISDINSTINLKFWFRQKSRQSELTTYYESSTKNTVTQNIKTHNLEMYESEFMSIEDLIMIAEILEKPVLFVNDIRCSLFEAIKIPELTQQENFGKIKFTLAPNN